MLVDDCTYDITGLTVRSTLHGVEWMSFQTQTYNIRVNT